MRRPDAVTKRDKPWFLPPSCLDCGAPLVVGPVPLITRWDDEGNGYSEPAPEGAEPWYDEWMCSAGCEGILLDWPPEFVKMMKEQMDDKDSLIPWEEIRRSGGV